MEEQLKKALAELKKQREKDGSNEQIDNKIKQIEKIIKLIEKFRGKKLGAKEIAQAQEFTCFKNLAYCCKKPCFNRNVSLMLLGIQPSEFEREKERIFNEWVEKRVLKKK